jgi:gamma-glutamyltranspeptidase/glutathione hydrolase
MKTPILLGIAMTLGLAQSSLAQQQSDVIAPEAATGTMTAARTATGHRFMVAAANPLAVDAGADVLRRGGTAADALVTIQTVLGLVEPQSSGLGGGAFLLWYDADTQTLTSFDARETAPAKADGMLFLDETGEPLDFFEAVIGGRSVGVPGVPLLLETVHERFGRLDWKSLLDPAITLAESGFEVSPRLAELVAGDLGRLNTQRTAAGYFYDKGGTPVAAGSVLVNRDYARSLSLYAEEGAQTFYRGALAHSIVNAVTSHPTNPGDLTIDDLSAYRVVERDPVCVPYRNTRVCGMGPPSSGGIAIGQILGMVEPYDLATLGPDDPVAWRIIGDATRLAFADRGLYVADTDFTKMPDGLLDSDYLASRSALIRRDTAIPQSEMKAGEPPWDKAELRIEGRDLPQEATTHIVVVDEDGNIASMTSSIENAFGSRLMVGGFLLNNQLTDFSFAPEADGAAVANRIEGAKRPRSSMAPTIVVGADGQPLYALGSPGGASIIPYVANTLIRLIDWQQPMAEALSAPHLINTFGTYVLESGTPAEALATDLQALGYETAIRDLNSGLHGITIKPDRLTGAADPRREGTAEGG